MKGFEPVRISETLEPLSGELSEKSLYAVFGSFDGSWSVMEFSNWDRTPRLRDRRRGEILLNGASWESSLNMNSYQAYVEEIRAEIARGWVYQVNACRLLSTENEIDLAELFDSIQLHHDAPVAGYWKSMEWEIASASPETFFKVERRDGKRILTTRPIKGTSRDGNFTRKDSAENVMIVDLMRNDISPLCKSGSVTVPLLLKVEEHPGLFHLVSDVEGELKETVTWRDILERLTPAGSISGAPKSSALEVISRREPYRGAYCGTLGWIHNGEAHFSVLIRTFFKDFVSNGSKTFFGTGAGITWGSEPEAEWQETELKAERLIALACGKVMVT